MKTYKQSLKYNSEWEAKWRWMEYVEHEFEDGMYCTVCKQYGKPPVQARGAWVSRPISNWVKATELLSKHEKSEWHRAAVQTQTLAVSTQSHGSVFDQMVAASD